MDTRILTLLREARPDWVSSRVLRQADGVSRVTVSKRVRTLQSLGYRIESSPGKGYRLQEEPQAIVAEDVQARLSGSTLYQHPFVIKTETGSTNDDLKALAEQGAPGGTVVFSERQLQGRGRRGRTWFATPGDALQFSLLLRPPLPPGQGTLIPLLAAAGVHRAFHRLGVQGSGIKWPNDVLLNGKKVCGILCEMSVSLEGIDYALLGMGLNVATPAEAFPEELRPLACSLASSTGADWDRTQVWVTVLQEIEALVHPLWAGDVTAVLDAWREGAVTPGQTVDLTRADGAVVSGLALGVTGEGALRLRMADGTEQVFHSGEVSLRPQR